MTQEKRESLLDDAGYRLVTSFARIGVTSIVLRVVDGETVRLICPDMSRKQMCKFLRDSAAMLEGSHDNKVIN